MMAEGWVFSVYELLFMPACKMNFVIELEALKNSHFELLNVNRSSQI